MKKVLIAILGFIIFSSCEEAEKIEKPEKWSNFIVGKWEYEKRYDYNGNLEVRVGEVEYFPDSSFTKTAIIKFFYSYGKSKGDEDFIGGGVVKGEWYVDVENSKLVEKINYCNINHSHKTSRVKEDYNACDWEYKDQTYTYGDDFTDYKKSELLSFWEKIIKTKTIYFETDGIEEYVATKVK
ncbi:MAG: hypothetical protein R2795_17005 [Saprospiraceae bacterium]